MTTTTPKFVEYQLGLSGTVRVPVMDVDKLLDDLKADGRRYAAAVYASQESFYHGDKPLRVESTPTKADDWDADAHTDHENTLHYGLINAAAIRRIAKDAGLLHLIDRVTASRKRTYIRLHWSEVKDDERDYPEHALALQNAISAAYGEAGRKAVVDVVWKGTLVAQRRADKAEERE